MYLTYQYMYMCVYFFVKLKLLFLLLMKLNSLIIPLFTIVHYCILQKSQSNAIDSVYSCLVESN